MSALDPALVFTAAGGWQLQGGEAERAYAQLAQAEREIEYHRQAAKAAAYRRRQARAAVRAVIRQEAWATEPATEKRPQ